MNEALEHHNFLKNAQMNLWFDIKSTNLWDQQLRYYFLLHHCQQLWQQSMQQKHHFLPEWSSGSNQGIWLPAIEHSSNTYAHFEIDTKPIRYENHLRTFSYLFFIITFAQIFDHFCLFTSNITVSEQILSTLPVERHRQQHYYWNLSLQCVVYPIKYDNV